MESTGYNLHDLKAQTVIGVSSSTGYQVQLGGIYGIAGTTEVTPPTAEVTAEAPAGTVPLTIARDGANIKLNWDAATYPAPQIFARSASFDNSYDGTNWTKVAGGGGIIGGVTGFSGYSESGGTGTLLNDNQVGAGSSDEVYYKAVISTVNVTTPTGQATLESAWAVGKVNVQLNGTAATLGKNLISLPFQTQQSMTVRDVLGEGTGTVWTEGDMAQYKFDAGPAYYTAIYTSGKQWKDAANTSHDPAFNFDYRFGNWIIVNEPKVVTMVGGVVNTDMSVAIYSGAGLPTGGKTLLGMLYPAAFGLAATSLIADGAAEGDLIQYKLDPLAPAYISAVVSSGVWKNAANPGAALDPRIATLTVPNGYIFVRYGSTGLVWNRTRPF